MTTLDSIVPTGQNLQPPRILIYGPHKIGKTTFAASAPQTIFIQTEDGTDVVRGAKAFPLANTFSDVLAAMQALHEGEHSFRTLAVDSLDWMERLIWQAVAEEKEVGNLEDIGYGKGYVLALDHWRLFLDWVQALRRDRGMQCVLLAHAEIKRFDAPDCESYDRYQPALHKSASAMIQEAVDVIGFCNWQTSVRKEKQGFSEKAKAQGSGVRLLHLQERPSYLAGSRYSLPATMQMDWNTFSEALTAAVTDEAA